MITICQGEATLSLTCHINVASNGWTKTISDVENNTFSNVDLEFGKSLLLWIWPKQMVKNALRDVHHMKYLVG